MKRNDDAVVIEPAVLIRINRSYREGMSKLAPYEATRGVWKIGPRRERAHFALAVYRGVVVEVYEIHDWHPAGTTKYETRKLTDPRGRWEFTGSVAASHVRDKYVGKSVANRFKRGSANPVVYMNVA